MLPLATNTQRYEAVLRISEALSECREPEELAIILAEQLAEFLSFDHLDVLVFKENSTEIEWHACGKGPLSCPDVPAEELPGWNVYDSQETLYIADWNQEGRFPRLKQFIAESGIKLGSIVRIPLTTPHRRLGSLGIASSPGITYGSEDVGFLRLIARVVAFAIDDGLNLRRAKAAHECVRCQNERLQLLLGVTNRITSNLELRELLRAVAANIREVMQCDAVAISLPDAESGKFRVYALDFPQGKGLFREELLASPTGASKRVLETLKPAIVNGLDPEDIPPDIYEFVVAEGFKSHCLIPLVNRARALGLLGIGRTSDESFTEHDLEFLTQLSGQIAIAIENALAYREISELKDKLAQVKLYLEEEIRSEMHFEQIVGSSAALKHVLEMVHTVAPSDSTVLLLGETR